MVVPGLTQLTLGIGGTFFPLCFTLVMMLLLPQLPRIFSAGFEVSSWSMGSFLHLSPFRVLFALLIYDIFRTILDAGRWNRHGHGTDAWIQWGSRKMVNGNTNLAIFWHPRRSTLLLDSWNPARMNLPNCLEVYIWRERIIYWNLGTKPYFFWAIAAPVQPLLNRGKTIYPQWQWLWLSHSKYLPSNSKNNVCQWGLFAKLHSSIIAMVPTISLCLQMEYPEWDKLFLFSKVFTCKFQ